MNPKESAQKIFEKLIEKIINTSSGIEINTETFGKQTNSAILLISGAMASAHFLDR